MLTWPAVSPSAVAIGASENGATSWPTQAVGSASIRARQLSSSPRLIMAGNFERPRVVERSTIRSRLAST